jgi:Transglutaminase-like superfamily
MPNPITKTFRLLFGAGHKFVSQPGEAWLLCRMAWWVGVVSAATRVYPLPRALQIVAGPEPTGKVNTAAGVQERLARSIDLLLSADVLVFKPICWKRAAVLHRYLAQNGIATSIIFGVRNQASHEVEGHAWLELDGQPILESSPPEYVITYRFPSDQPFEGAQAFSAEQ